MPIKSSCLRTETVQRMANKTQICAGPEPGQARGLFPLPANPDRPARTNMNIKWLVGLAALAVIGVVIGITVTYTTGNEDTDECQSIPCQNGGRCVDGIDGYACHCLPGYNGTSCQTDTDECKSIPCQNRGRCVDGIDGYVCHCLPGYSGTSCQTDTDECQSVPCQNRGRCVDGIDGYACHCLPGYSGTSCQTDTDECERSPCQNGGTCEDLVNGFSCRCHPRYSRNGCQTENTGCDSQPCRGRGVCNTRGQEHTCQCLPGYSGPSCQTDTDECESGPCVKGGTCVDRVNGYTCLCRPRYHGDDCQGSQVAFSVFGPTTQETTSWRRVEYKKIHTDLGGAYRNSTFYTPSASVYYVAMSACTQRHVSYRLVGAPHSLGLTTTSTNLYYRSLGREYMLEIPSRGEIGIQYTGKVRSGKRTLSWSMFSLKAAFHPLVAFTVTRTIPTTEHGKVPYTESLVNTGGGYRPADSHFVAPADGTYFFSVSAGVAARQKARLHIVKNDVREVELLNTDTTHNGTEMISSAAIVKLSLGDRVHVELVEGAVFSGSEFRETSFSGFLYSPVHGQSIAWSVWRTDSWTAGGHAQNGVPYDTVLVNEGGVYDTSYHHATIPVSGVYCVHLVGGAPSGGRRMTVYLSYGHDVYCRSDFASINDHSTGRNGVTTVSNSMLITVEAGYHVFVWAYTGNGMYSNPGLVTGFSGFLVYPT